ncbi:GNAT family N-acetyltransferase [Serratia sp. MYb239]|uniref:GNAT family N-acetyltransferase n=1 Tax=Serratia sp. MYb239 TaxID=2033438 RepID=UPI000CF6A8B2|nr:GNAT family N-acetyltransferase [Serratia sp. MYb239]AVJ16876.1 GNAT family N-acetyltransferase [Serratia sp. MYb239]QPT14873.1 GNAT family N-acetyltransferase [Serratia rubidaea]
MNSPRFTAAPRLTTERLILDTYTLNDFDAVAAMSADPQVMRYIGGGAARDREESWGRLLRYIGHWQLLGYGYWAVREKHGGQFIGSLGFANYQRDITPALEAPEMGWTLCSAAHGKGYATEALRAVLAWGKTALPGGRTQCIISPHNQPSIKLAHKLGFRETHRAEYHQRTVLVMEQTL